MSNVKIQHVHTCVQTQNKFEKSVSCNINTQFVKNPPLTIRTYHSFLKTLDKTRPWLEFNVYLSDDLNSCPFSSYVSLYSQILVILKFDITLPRMYVDRIITTHAEFRLPVQRRPHLCKENQRKCHFYLNGVLYQKPEQR